MLMLIKRYGGNFDFLCAAVPVKFFGSLLAGGVWVNSDPVASLAPGLKGLNSSRIGKINLMFSNSVGIKYLLVNQGV